MPELIRLFLPGFIFMCIYTKLHNKKYDIAITCLWSLFISYLIAAFYTFIHSCIHTNYDVAEHIKILFYVATGAVLPFGITFLSRSNLFRNFLLKTNYQTINSDIFDDVIDYEKKILMTVYLKDSSCYYIGTFSLKGDKDENSYITLIDYATMNAETNELISRNEKYSTVIIGLHDIERIEIKYCDDSEVWKRLEKGNN